MVFARIRYGLASGDFDRSANQARVLRGIQRKVRARAADPGFIERGVISVMENLHTDLPPAELFRLAQAMAQVDPAKVTSCVVQGSIGNIGGASVVLPYVEMARRSVTRPARTPRSALLNPPTRHNEQRPHRNSGGGVVLGGAVAQ